MHDMTIWDLIGIIPFVAVIFGIAWVIDYLRGKTPDQQFRQRAEEHNREIARKQNEEQIRRIKHLEETVDKLTNNEKQPANLVRNVNDEDEQILLIKETAKSFETFAKAQEDDKQREKEHKRLIEEKRLEEARDRRRRHLLYREKVKKEQEEIERQKQKRLIDQIEAKKNERVRYWETDMDDEPDEDEPSDDLGYNHHNWNRYIDSEADDEETQDC